jgi:cytochrome P450
MICSTEPEKFARDTLASYVKDFGRGDTGRRNLLTKLLSADLPDPQIEVEINGLTFAAVDTTSTVMTYVMYEMCRNPDWQVKLRAELLAADLDERGYAVSLLNELPLLNAIIEETLRLHPPAMSGMPRITPASGAVIDGIFVPGNVSSYHPIRSRNPYFFD